ncbi:helix-turn-helix transcriptional regulator [Phytoactinopolyspora mesophila]|nr:helix-turn-helix transcriptional regulator [Phytoactinopolyspora mesophila]
MRRAHSYSPSAVQTARVLGLEIARARRAQRMSQVELAERAGISENTLRSVERGAPTVAVGIVFEVARLVGLDLLGVQPSDLSDIEARSRERLALLPARVRPRPGEEIDDDF